MLVDTAKLMNGQTLSADVCVIGAGPAGITVAHELCGGPLDVCLLESGGLVENRLTTSLTRGESAGQAYYPLHRSRSRTFGGSSSLWFTDAGVHTRPLEDVDFAMRPWIPYSGWPFGLNHLLPFYSRAYGVFGLERGVFEAEHGPEPCLPLDVTQVFTPLFQAGQDRTFRDYFPEFVKARNVKLVLNATVMKIEASRDAPRVERLQVLADGAKALQVSARVYVLAAGGIENARLLLLSNSRYKAGLGNQNDLVGRFFMEHLHVNAGHIASLKGRAPPDLSLYEKRSAGKTSVFGGLAVAPQAQAAAGIGGFCVMVHTTAVASVSKGMRSLRHLWHAARRGLVSRTSVAHLRSVAGNIDDVLRASFERLTSQRGRRVAELLVMAEQQPNPESRVTLSDQRDQFGQRRARLEWRLTAGDYDTIRCGELIIDGELRRANVAQLKGKFADQSPAPTIGGGWHHMGTTRMHDDPSLGVVDADCKVHGVSNLYVAGTSVFPTGGFANPTLTAVALSVRLAQHVQAMLGNVEVL